MANAMGAAQLGIDVTDGRTSDAFFAVFVGAPVLTLVLLVRSQRRDAVETHRARGLRCAFAISQASGTSLQGHEL
jgi:bacteriorhodopsin